MALDSQLLTELILSPTGSTLGQLVLDRDLQPGAHLDFEGQIYLILERKHRYRLESGQYRLHQVFLYVQKSHAPAERSLCGDRWVIGDATCGYNARSELLRCAVNPEGPCDRCVHYHPIEPAH